MRFFDYLPAYELNHSPRIIVAFEMDFLRNLDDFKKNIPQGEKFTMLLQLGWSAELVEVATELKNRLTEAKNSFPEARFIILANTAKEVEIIKDGLRKFGEENEYLMEFLPVKYRWPDAIYFMLQAVENLRADSLKEVINLYEQELHLLEQERILNNNALMQQRYNESLQQMMQVIDANQQQINSNLKFVQTLQFLNLFDD